MRDVEELVEEFNPEEPLIKASKKCRRLHEYADKLAYAAHHHPAVMYENSSEIIGTQYVEEEELSQPEAHADLFVLSYFLSEAWQEAQEYFMFDFREEFYHYLEYNDSGNQEPEMEAFKELNEKYDELDEAVQELDKAVSLFVEEKQNDDANDGYTMEPAGAKLRAD